MTYKIGEILEQKANETGKAYRVFAIDAGLGETEFSAIRCGKRVASPKKLSGAIDLETLKEPLLIEIREYLDSLDADVVIDIYNLIYNKVIK